LHEDKQIAEENVPCSDVTFRWNGSYMQYHWRNNA